MTPEEKSLLERTYKLSEENNAMLRGIRRSTRLANAMRIIYWIVILGVSVGAYYAVEPYIKFLLGSLGSLTDLTSNVGSADVAAQSLRDLMK